jgi:hydroxymethylbilane synthase
VRIGTRASALALAQAGLVAELLGSDVQLVPVATSRGAAAANDKERWVKQLEIALLNDDIDIAVHSAKDVPSTLPEGLELVGTPLRADPYDALVGAESLDALPAGARIGTSSVRRTAQLRARREDLDVVAISGNVDTRLRRLADDEFDALVLAAAGLHRLGRGDAIGGVLSELVPAPGQGTLVLEARAGDQRAGAAARAVTHAQTWTALCAERALVARLDASCHTPLGAHATVGEDGIVLRSFVGLPDGSAWLADEAPAAASPEEAGEVAAQRVLSAGGGELLRLAEELAA